ncbi:hypothetical protein NUW54_g13206 [Trametes sanguinea]|uniref:Uncharacterized protein n=1 Tax=Trametes sanguinea TaxID=158606 RepID=A0ACC1MNT0_9APHY|nr:hypothetical protein NUW54_g13206 [Trametes sanguinea]
MTPRRCISHARISERRGPGYVMAGGQLEKAPKLAPLTASCGRESRFDRHGIALAPGQALRARWPLSTAFRSKVPRNTRLAGWSGYVLETNAQVPRIDPS